jgi:hypothetical protein
MIAIVGVLMALVLSAVQAAREAARRAQCKNNLRQLAVAAVTHHEQIGHFPTSGWGWRWVGDADRGFGEEQPGNWTYNLLPFMEEQALHDLAGDGLPNLITPRQLEGGRRLTEAAIPILYCPSRRAAVAYPHIFYDVAPPINAAWADVAGALDYAINCGDTSGMPKNFGPPSLQDSASFPWGITSTGVPLQSDISGIPLSPINAYLSPITGEYGVNGISFRRSEVSLRHITDGASNTYLIGEWHVTPDEYDMVGEGGAWCASLTSHACGFEQPILDGADGTNPFTTFGSAHPSGFHVAYCDGRVHFVAYDVALGVHRAAANRKDGSAHGAGVSNERWPVPPLPPRRPDRPPR